MDPTTEVALRGWTWALRLGVLFAVLGLVDLALAWLPAVDSAEFRVFALVASGVEMLPLVTLGSGVALAAAFALDRPRLMRLTGGALLAIALVLFANLLLFVLEVPGALEAVEEQPPLAILGMHRTVVRTAAFALIAGTGHFVGGFVALYVGLFGRPAPIV